jgi:hypothetical protein
MGIFRIDSRDEFHRRDASGDAKFHPASAVHPVGNPDRMNNSDRMLSAFFTAEG